MVSTQVRTGYAPAGELEMYYEVHGSGRPLVLLHGAYLTVDALGPLLAGLARDHEVLAPELEGHGRTALSGRPLSYEQMADDTAALIRHAGLEQPDVVGYSMGAGTALQLAIRHSGLVRRLVLISTGYASDGLQPQAAGLFPAITPAMFAGSSREEEYLRLAPRPGDFPALVERLTALFTEAFAWPEEDIRAIPAPTLVVTGDSDLFTLEHSVALFRLRGGGVMGDLAGMPASQLAVLPGSSHLEPPGHGVLDRTDWLLAMIRPFLDAG